MASYAFVAVACLAIGGSPDVVDSMASSHSAEDEAAPAARDEPAPPATSLLRSTLVLGALSIAGFASSVVGYYLLAATLLGVGAMSLVPPNSQSTAGAVGLIPFVVGGLMVGIGPFLAPVLGGAGAGLLVFLVGDKVLGRSDAQTVATLGGATGALTAILVSVLSTAIALGGFAILEGLGVAGSVPQEVLIAPFAVPVFVPPILGCISAAAGTVLALVLIADDQNGDE